MMIEQLIALAIIATVAPIISALSVYALGRYKNIGPLTTEVREESEALVSTLRHRLDLVEADLEREKRHGQKLAVELADEKRKNDDLTDRVTALEKRIVEMAMEKHK